MKKNTKFMVIAAAVMALMIGVPQVQAFAISALSVFRVGDAKTITITLEDLAQMSENAKAYAEEFKTYDLENKHGDYDVEGKLNLWDGEKPEYLTLNDVNEFTGFDVNLPRELNDETPKLLATEVMEHTFTTDANESITVALSPMLVAKYDQVVFMATQGISENVPVDVKVSMWEKLVAAPILTDNIRMQLAAIDPNTKDIYLPVITGVTREANLGGTTGYLYSASDLQTIMGELPNELSATVMLWTKNGVLYVLAGEVSDSELIAIARSVR